ncbi:MAG: type II secretion system protein, partial [Patescibacteria group bacterium]
RLSGMTYNHRTFSLGNAVEDIIAGELHSKIGVLTSDFYLATVNERYMNCPVSKKQSRGFTLIELLVVIGILAVLLSIVLIAINPARQFSQANNTKRRSDTVAILNAISQYSADNKGSLPSQVTTTVQNIANTGADLCTPLSVTVQYLSAFPRDPLVSAGAQITDCAVAYDTGYSVVKDASNRVTVAAPQAELSETISVTR